MVTPYDEDVTCQGLVRKHGGMQIIEVGQAMGVTRQRAQQILWEALRVHAIRMRVVLRDPSWTSKDSERELMKIGGMARGGGYSPIALCAEEDGAGVVL